MRAAVNGSISFAFGTGAHLWHSGDRLREDHHSVVALGWAAVTSVFEITVSCVGAGRSGTAGTECRDTRALSAVPVEARRIICARARIDNLTIVIQPQRGYDSYDNSIPFARPAALFCTCHTSSMALFGSDGSGFAGAAAAVRPARCTTRARSPVLHRRGAVEPAIMRHCSERCTCANGRDAAGLLAVCHRPSGDARA
ncbi:hypothetical protein GGD64_007082 [Bradyrhizobium sp. CIR3A]|nr:hypothetical protein [Bradyrhizobium sp. CIR3A]